MKKVIIAIHGLGNKPDSALLHESWLQAVHEGLAHIGKPHRKIPYETVYWADVSYPDPLDPDIDDPEHPLFLKEPYTESQTAAAPQKRRHLKLFALTFIEKHLDRLFLKKNLEETFPDAMNKLMERYFSDLDTYYTQECTTPTDQDCSAKAAIHDRLIQMLKKYAGYDVLLIAHSMGSIIAFDVLWEHPEAFQINTFLTMGSPLGLPPIVSHNFQAQQLLNPELKQPCIPDTIWPHWYNISDRRDTVALDHTLRDDYAANAKGMKIVDLLTTNDYAVNGHANPHKSFGYLRSPDVARIIDTFLTEKPAGRFQKKCELILGNISASTRRVWKKVAEK